MVIIAFCDLLSFEADTIFMALVICMVEFTDSIRVLTSFKLAMAKIQIHSMILYLKAAYYCTRCGSKFVFNIFIKLTFSKIIKQVFMIFFKVLQ